MDRCVQVYVDNAAPFDTACLVTLLELFVVLPIFTLVIFSYPVDTLATAYTSSSSRNNWQGQHYHTPNDFPTTKDASFHVESSKTVTVYKLQFLTYILVWSFCAQAHVCKATNLRLYYTPKDNYTIIDASFV